MGQSHGPGSESDRKVCTCKNLGNSASPAWTRFSVTSTATTETVNSSYSGFEFQSTCKDFDDIDLKTCISKKTADVQNEPQVYTIDPNPPLLFPGCSTTLAMIARSQSPFSSQNQPPTRVCFACRQSHRLSDHYPLFQTLFQTLFFIVHSTLQH